MNYRKIITSVALKLLAMLVIIFILNNCLLLKKSFHAEIADLTFWFENFNIRHLLLISGMGIYFAYTSVEKEKARLDKTKDWVEVI